MVMRRDHVARWELGGLQEETEREAVGRLKAFVELEGLEWGHMKVFYDGPDYEDDPDNQHQESEHETEDY